jgi:hypothetical protein
MRHDRTCEKRAAAAALAVVWGCGVPGAEAADWDFLPRIAVGAFTNDNYTLEPDSRPAVDVEGGRIDAQFPLRAATPRTEFTLTPQVKSAFLPDDEEWETTDGFLWLDWRHQGERFEARLRADYSDESTLSSELPGSDADGDLGDPDGGDSGLVAIDNRRQRLRFRPGLSVELTERSALLADLRYEDAEYDEQGAGGTEGYTDADAWLAYRFRVSPMSTITVRGIASRYEREIDSVKTDGYGVRLEWVSRISEVSQWYLRLGAREVDRPESLQTPGASSSETGYDSGVGVDWTFQVTQLFLDATVSVQPNSSGRLIERDNLRLRLIHQFGPRLIGYLNARGSRDTALADDLGTFPERNYATGTVGLEWRMTREFSLLGEYGASWQDREGAPSDATSNEIALSFVYQRQRSD